MTAASNMNTATNAKAATAVRTAQSFFPALALILALTSSLFFAGCAAQTGTVSGRVLFDDEPAEGVLVTLADAKAVARVAGKASGKKAALRTALTALTDADGTYTFPAVASGDYRVGARLDGERPLVAARRFTPVHLGPDSLKWVGLKLVEWEGVVYRPEAGANADSDANAIVAAAVGGFGSISGTVLYRGVPVSDGVVTLYLDYEEGLKGPGFRQSFATGDEGQFYLAEVSEGRYYAVARKRATGAAGPVREGDLYGEATAVPLLVRSGMEGSIDIHVVKKEKTQPPNAAELDATATAITGRILDSVGSPVAGVYVFAYRDRTIGHKMPDFLTPTTGADGKFILPLGEGGLFYVGAREFFGGSPRPGERFGLFEGSADHGIRVKEGEKVGDIVIRVNEVLPQ
jgi:hypothetical protein